MGSSNRSSNKKYPSVPAVKQASVRRQAQRKFIYDCVKIAQEKEIRVVIDGDKYPHKYEMSPEYWIEQLEKIPEKTKVMDGIIQSIIKAGSSGISVDKIYMDLLRNDLLPADAINIIGNKERRFMMDQYRDEILNKFMHSYIEMAQEKGIKIDLTQNKISATTGDNYYRISPEYGEPEKQPTENLEYWKEQTKNLAKKTKAVNDIVRFVAHNKHTTCQEVYEYLVENNLLSSDERSVLEREDILKKQFIHYCIELYKLRQKRNQM